MTSKIMCKSSYSAFRVVTGGLGILCILSIASAQATTAQCNDFGSNFQISKDQVAALNITSQAAEAIAVAINFERSNWAYGAVATDSFFEVPPDSANKAAGTLLKVQEFANISLYTLPANTALSRILFQSENINGTLVPASAYVLWPYSPRTLDDGYQVVAWSHGNDGATGECAPSHYQNLLFQYAVPFTLALQGYVVVAPDYQGFGVTKDASGNPIAYTQFNSPSHANDIFYSVEAAQSAFKELSKKFVVMGHSEGGASAWAAAERQAKKPVDGHLGTIAASPLTNFLLIAEEAVALGFGSAVAELGVGLTAGLTSIFPSFNISEFLTEAGETAYNFMKEIQGCSAVGTLLLSRSGLLHDNFTSSFYLQAYQGLVKTGGKKISGPLLVLQGTADMAVPEVLTDIAVNETCTAFPKSQLQYITFQNVTHEPVMFASQRTWLNWIEDRFNGVPVPSGCTTNGVSSARPYESYNTEDNWYIELATSGYELN
jgi:pimeloyl-ACP methyl ester carboxylesterase